MESALQHDSAAQFTKISSTGSGNDSSPDPETTGIRGCDSLTFIVDLLMGAGQGYSINAVTH